MKLTPCIQYFTFLLLVRISYGLGESKEAIPRNFSRSFDDCHDKLLGYLHTLCAESSTQRTQLHSWVATQVTNCCLNKMEDIDEKFCRRKSAFEGATELENYEFALNVAGNASISKMEFELYNATSILMKNLEAFFKTEVHNMLESARENLYSNESGEVSMEVRGTEAEALSAAVNTVQAAHSLLVGHVEWINSLLYGAFVLMFIYWITNFTSTASALPRIAALCCFCFITEHVLCSVYMFCFDSGVENGSFLLKWVVRLTALVLLLQKLLGQIYNDGHVWKWIKSWIEGLVADSDSPPEESTEIFVSNPQDDSGEDDSEDSNNITKLMSESFASSPSSTDISYIPEETLEDTSSSESSESSEFEELADYATPYDKESPKEIEGRRPCRLRIGSAQP